MDGPEEGGSSEAKAEEERRETRVAGTLWGGSCIYLYVSIDLG